MNQNILIGWPGVDINLRAVGKPVLIAGTDVSKNDMGAIVETAKHKGKFPTGIAYMRVMTLAPSNSFAVKAARAKK